jgi:DNA-binding response OmpR family regulator
MDPNAAPGSHDSPCVSRPGAAPKGPRNRKKPGRCLLFAARLVYFEPRAVATNFRGPEEMVNSRRILIVDDDADMRDALVEQLALHDEFEAVAVETGSKGVQAARAGEIDLVIMDVGLPDIDGREAVRMLRTNGFKAPVIMLTGHDTDSDTSLGLESGANDYVAKPFRFAVLLARIRAQLRQHDASEDAVFNIGPYTFRPSSKLLVNPKGNKVRLTEKETAILRYLYRAGRRPVSREILLQEVWGYNSGVTTHTLETHIYRLRQKVEKDASNPSILVTEAGGYKLIP